MTTPTRDAILNALAAFVAQRPGLEYGNYGDPSTYRAELCRITKMRHDAEALIAKVRQTGITAEALLAAFRSFSGRLTPVVREDGAVALHYCTGQYWPTEYRAAVCSVLTTALWDYWRDDYAERHGTTEGTREAIQRNARLAFRSRSIRQRFV